MIIEVVSFRNDETDEYYGSFILPTDNDLLADIETDSLDSFNNVKTILLERGAIQVRLSEHYLTLKTLDSLPLERTFKIENQKI